MNKNRNTARKMLTMESKVRTFSIKIYDEQLPLGWEKTCEAINAVDKNKMQILAICHDSDYNSDDIWLPSIEKSHYHIIGRGVNGYSIRIKQVLEMLHIEFRQKIDDELWKHHGIETVANFPNMSVYLTHETDEAILDAKTVYPIEKIVSNLTKDEIIEVRQGYIRVGQNGGYKKTYVEMAELDAIARNLGYQLQNFNNWCYDLDFGTRCNAKLKIVEKSYFDGVAKRVRDDGTIVRLCIFIKGAKNTGKTFASRQALAGREILEIGGGGTGKFDKLLPSTDAILVSDDVCPNLLNMTDNYMCQAYKRQSNNPFWCGDVFVVTSNLEFRDWLEKCNVKTKNSNGTDSEHYRAMESRFFICSIEKCGEHNYLACSSPSTRGSNVDQQIRKNMFIKFRDKFNAVMAEYTPDSKNVTYDDIVDFFPVTDVNPFEIVNEKNGTETIDKIDKTAVFETSECKLDYYQKKIPVLYEKANNIVRKKFAKMGVYKIVKNEMFNEALLYECAQLDISGQYKRHRKKQKCFDGNSMEMSI